MSPSSRRAWIEIVRYVCQWSGSGVALLAEGVDRNFAHRVYHKHTSVALLAEGVDRNSHLRLIRWISCVALLAEGVDRNIVQISLSARA